MPVRYTFKKNERLCRNRDFVDVLTKGKSFSCPQLTLYVTRIRAAGPSRIGLAVGKRFGNAVERNRMKRLLREIFRLNKHRIFPGCDIIVIPRRSAMELAYRELEVIFLGVLTKAGIVP